MKQARQRVDVNLPELDAVLDQARHEPLSEPDYLKLKTALHALAGLAAPPHRTEKTSAVVGDSGNTSDKPEESPDGQQQSSPKRGHGRNGAAAYSGADKAKIQHAKLKNGDRCPECEKGKVYVQKEPKPLVRVIGQAPLAATVYELERLRCNGCGQVFTAEEPAGIGPDKYDETTAAMIAQLKYGSGVPFYRLEKLEHNLGIPMPAATQWEIVEEAAEVLKPAQEELIRQAAQGEVLHNDDTSMRVLRLAREPSDKRTGVFYRPPARGRESGGCVEAPCGGTAPAHSDVRCAVAQSAQASGGRRDSDCQLPRARETAVCRDHSELSQRMPLRSRDAGESLWSRS